MPHVIKPSHCFCVSSLLEHIVDTMQSVSFRRNRNLGDNTFRSFKAGILDGLGSLTSL